MIDDEASKWDARYRTAPAVTPQPARAVAQYAHLLPPRGKALEVACGLGGNALLLARLGLHTEAWDISAVAIERLRSLAQEQGLTLTATQRDVLVEPPAAAGYDVIVVTRFLDRSLCPALAAALRPDGLLYYQTFVQERVTDHGPGNPAFLLAPGELLQLFPGLLPLAYHDEGRIGDPARGWRDEACLVAQKPR